MLMLIHYGEIGLKGKNRGAFEDRLLSNIRKALGKRCSGAKIEQKRIFIEVKGKEGEITESLKKVSGIEWFAFVHECKPEIEGIWKCVGKELGRLGGKKFGVRTKRSDKDFPLKSMELSAEIGGRIVEATGAKVDLRNPEITVDIEIMRGKALVFFGKVRGVGGLPVGSAGKVLCLMSGGIDSPVAAQLMMKRGCEVDYLHVHQFEGKNAGRELAKSKILKLVEILNAYQQREAKLFAVPYSGFYARTGKVERRYELVVFRRYLYRLAERVAKEYGYLGIVGGDSLGQVASQTLENIACAQAGLEVPVFRPLICMNKMDIVSAAEGIGTYAESVKEYADCCSLVSVKNPVTKARRETVEEYYAEMGIGELIEENLGNLGGREKERGDMGAGKGRKREL